MDEQLLIIDLEEDPSEYDLIPEMRIRLDPGEWGIAVYDESMTVLRAGN